jgi:flagellar biosynthesis/type III secretory pathway protein FliH
MSKPSFSSLWGAKPAAAGDGGFQLMLRRDALSGRTQDFGGGFSPGQDALTEIAAPPNLETMLEQARDEGRREAADAFREQLVQAEADLTVAAAALEEVATLRSAILRSSADQIGDLVVQLARRVLGQSLALHPEALPGVVRDAVALLPERDELVVRVPPSAVERIEAVFKARSGVKVIADPDIAVGCHVEAGHAAIDATLDAAIEGIEAAVRVWAEDRR